MKDMKRRFSGYAALLLLAGAAVASCHRDTMDYNSPHPSEEVGSAGLSGMKVRFKDELEVITRATVVDVDGFLVKVLDSESTPVYENTYGNLPQSITLKTGSYDLQVESHEVKPAEWETPWYFATEPVVIEKDRTTDVGTIVCKIGNIKVSVNYSDELRAVMGDDCKATVTIDKGALDYTASETRAGFFAAAQESNAMTVEFSGTVGGVTDRFTKVFNNVKGGQHRILNFTYNTPPAEGDVTFGVNVDVECKVIDLNYNVDITEDVIPDDGDVNDPAKAPTIVWKEGDIKSNDPTRIVKTGTDSEGIDTYDPEVTIVVEAEYKIKNFYVEIISDILTEDVLTGVGLASSFDLTAPGELETMLRDNLGFPTGSAVLNKTAVEFSITSFIPLLDMVASSSEIRNAVHQFKLTVIDQKGNKEIQTLKLVTD